MPESPEEPRKESDVLDTEAGTDTDNDAAQAGTGGAGGARRDRRLRVTAGIAAALLVAAAAGLGVWRWTMALPGDAVAAVGDTVITTDDLGERISTVRALYGIEPPVGREALQDFRRDAVHSMVIARVLDEAAGDRGLQVPAEQRSAAVEAYVARFFGEGAEGQDAYARALGESGSSEPAVLEEVGRQLLVSRLYADVTGDVPIPTDDAVDQAFAERGCDVTVPEQRRLGNIVVSSRPRAERVRTILEGGTGFDLAARRFSLDTSTSTRGGRLGLVSQDQLEPRYGRLAFSTAPGRLFGPVRTRFGWNVGTVLGIEAQHRATLGEVRDDLRMVLLEEERTEAWRAWLRAAVRDAEVRYAEEYRPEDPDLLPDDQLVSGASEAQPGEPPLPDGCPA